MQRFFSSLKICNFAAVIKLSIMESEQKTPKRSGRKGWIVVGVAVVVVADDELRQLLVGRTAAAAAAR